MQCDAYKRIGVTANVDAVYDGSVPGTRSKMEMHQSVLHHTRTHEAATTILVYKGESNTINVISWNSEKMICRNSNTNVATT